MKKTNYRIEYINGIAKIVADDGIYTINKEKYYYINNTLINAYYVKAFRNDILLDFPEQDINKRLLPTLEECASFLADRSCTVFHSALPFDNYELGWKKPWEINYLNENVWNNLTGYQKAAAIYWHIMYTLISVGSESATEIEGYSLYVVSEDDMEAAEKFKSNVLTDEEREILYSFSDDADIFDCFEVFDFTE